MTLAACFAVPPGAEASPYRLDWGTDGKILGLAVLSGAAATSVGGDDALTRSEIEALSDRGVNWLDRSATSRYSTSAATASHALVGACVLAPLAMTTGPAMRHDWQVLGTMYLEVFFLANWMPDISKGLVDRVRPYLYNGDAPLDEKLDDGGAQRSFPSGHASMAFATAAFGATVLNDYHPGSRRASRLGKGLLLMAASAGGLRYAAGAHYPSDVLAGAALGSAIGYLVPRLHRLPGPHRLPAPNRAPVDGDGGARGGGASAEGASAEDASAEGDRGPAHRRLSLSPVPVPGGLGLACRWAL